MRLIHDAVEHFKYDWCNRRWLFWIEMVGTISAFIGAFGLAMFQGEAPFLLVYSIFLGGSVSGLISGNIRQSAWMVITSSVFTIVNLIGIVRALV